MTVNRRSDWRGVQTGPGVSDSVRSTDRLPQRGVTVTVFERCEPRDRRGGTSWFRHYPGTTEDEKTYGTFTGIRRKTNV